MGAPDPTEPRGARARRRVRLGWAVYLALLAASHVVQLARSPGHAPEPGLAAVEIPLAGDHGPVIGPEQRITYRRWRPEAPGGGEPVPIVLLHGSPGSGSDFSRLGPRLADAGYDVIAPDLPGFGGSTRQVPSYSLRAHAHAVLLCMDELGLERAHIVGWSQGGGVGLFLADLAPDRVATLTLMASIGVQEAEGSGSYAFEHLKYGVGYVGLVLGGEVVPHFGLLGGHDFRRSFIRNFWDSDQRPVRGIMQRLETPTLILHGKRDFLAPEWGARLHHELIVPSTLVVFDASHFLPVLQAGEVAGRMDHFYRQHETPGGLFIRETIDLTVPDNSLGARADRAMLWLRQHVAWWVVLATCGVLAFWRAEFSAAVAGFAVSMGWVDAGVACAGLLVGVGGRAGWMGWVGAHRLQAGATGRAASEPALASWRQELAMGRFGLMLRTRLQPWRRDEAAASAGAVYGFDPWASAGAAVGCAAWTGLAFLAGLIAASLARVPFGDGLATLAWALVVSLLAVRGVVFTCTWTGRQRIKATLRRARKHEFWPGWAYYAPLAPWLAWLGFRHGGLMNFTCVNPTIGAGGGVVGESKHEILGALSGLGGSVLAAVYLGGRESGERFARLKGAMADGTLPREYPVVLKPDAGQRGYAVRIARSDAEAREYLSRMDRPAIAQAFHPGPIEVGVMWVRDPDAEPGRVGRVFSLTTKHFSDLEGDGRHTIEQLIYRHRRFRCQADVLLTRFAGRRLEVPGPGERVRLVSVGNHSQGAIFRDAGEHITPALEAWIDGAAAAFCAPPAGGAGLPDGDSGLDFGRFDIRARSIEDLRNAEHLAIIELNGTAAESTSIYDPDRPLWWSWGMLLRQWEVLYRLGGRRRRMGVRPMGPLELRRAWQSFDRGRPAMRVAE